MHSKITVQRIVFILSIIVAGSVSALLFVTPRIVLDSPMDTAIRVSAVPGFPVRLVIPKIGVDDFIEYVGRTSEGAMDVPKDAANVGWYILGPKPREIGSAVIAGHSGWSNGKPAAFDHLYKLQKGDKIYIEDDKGMVSTFVVRETRNYDPTADASGVFGSTDGGVHLNLITCGGVWDAIEQASPNRLVVFTDKE